MAHIQMQIPRAQNEVDGARAKAQEYRDQAAAYIEIARALEAEAGEETRESKQHREWAAREEKGAWAWQATAMAGEAWLAF